MTLAKTSALVLALIGAVAFGVWIGPSLTERWNLDRGGAVVADAPAGRVAATPAAAGKSRPAPVTRTTAKRGPVATAAHEETKPGPVAATAPPTPELQQRLKPLLKRGADMTIASQGFRDGAQFAAVAHAARNTEIPFMLLKHRVVNEGKTLAAAIRESRPDLNADMEASRARAAAKSDLATLSD